MKKDKFDKKKNEIKAAGIKSFTAYGYSKTTLEDIASMLGMKKNSLYYYYDSKEALFRELIEDEISEHLEILNKITATDLPSDKKIIQIISTLSEFIWQRTLKYTIKLSAYIELTKVIKTEFQDFKENECNLIESLLSEGVEEGLFIQHNSKLLARDISNLVHAIFRSHYADSEVEFVHEINFNDIILLIKRLINYLIDGIKVKI